MPIKRTTTYICDCCGKEINHRKERYEVLVAELHNYYWDSDMQDFVYCESCIQHMWKAIRAIPRVKEAMERVEADGKDD